ncbi:inhibitor of cysteine peptidase [Amycolatopsis lexingtonensis]|uniref:Inhibitor of cysteine peptidase n=1 Tax=Amycolatopsis lexingtonensis TaxID=218822 RepID=A0ABR9HPZ6_9PSEU|nr:protease inhibitor I42 family protein [Amycolatopsis lexingtonensis]MBE1493003.1 inhibitor of cysteine peptidase [Amycolatopsis lexingtonensis]
MRVITLEADGAAADVAPGERLELRLPENAGTGYQWVLDGPEPPLRVVEETLHPVADRASGTGEHRFVLHADGPGETTLVARHARPWAPDSELRRFRLTVRVR